MSISADILRSASCRRAAFTIVEATVAMVVISIVVLTLYSAITSGFFSMRLARENLRATQVIVEKMEVIRLLTWDQLEARILPNNFSVPYDPTNPKERLIYRGKIAVEPLNPATRNYHPDMRKITVTVTWKSGELRRERELSTYVARFGIQNYVLTGNQGG